ncbi:MAG: hypothetical protein ACYC41_11120 [Bacillota bacterium]
MVKAMRVLQRWRLSWAVHLALAGMLAAGLMLYGVYSSWSARAGAASELIAPVLRMPGDMAVLAPEWSGALAAPALDLDALTRDALIQASARAMVPVIRTTALGPHGAVTVWGMNPSADMQEALPLLDGRWLAGPGEVVWPDSALPNAPRPGQQVTLRLPRDLSGDMVQWQATVVGTYKPDDVVRGPIVERSELAGLLGRQAANGIFLWQRSPTGMAFLTSSGMSSVVELDVAVVKRLDLQPVLQSTREPSLPPSATTGPRTGDVMALRGDLLPFGFLVGHTVLLSSTPSSLLTADAMARRMALFPAVMMLLLLLLVSVTTVTAALTVGRSEELGVYKTTGVQASVVQHQAMLEMITTVMLGTVLGLGGLWLMVKYGGMGLHLNLPWASLAKVWLPVVVVLGWWAGRAAGILYGTAETRSLLNRTASPDWWALIRFDLSGPRA